MHLSIYFLRSSAEFQPQLYSAKRQTISFRRGELMINRLLRMTIETGSACALCATLELAFFLGMPGTHMHFILYVALSFVYPSWLTFSRVHSALILSKGARHAAFYYPWAVLLLISTYCLQCTRTLSWSRSMPASVTLKCVKNPGRCPPSRSTTSRCCPASGTVRS